MVTIRSGGVPASRPRIVTCSGSMTATLSVFTSDRSAGPAGERPFVHQGSMRIRACEIYFRDARIFRSRQSDGEVVTDRLIAEVNIRNVDHVAVVAVVINRRDDLREQLESATGTVKPRDR